MGDKSVLAIRNSIPGSWIFREASSDYGIDCEIEIVDNDGTVTGAIIKGQIKGTSSMVLARKNNIAVSIQSIRYWLALPVPVVLFRVVEKPACVLWIDVREHVGQRQSIESIYRTDKKTFSFNFRNAYELPRNIQRLRSLAFEHQDVVCQVYKDRDEELGGQVIGLVDFALNFNCDPNAFIQWFRENGSIEQLVHDLPFALWIKEQIEKDPEFVDRVRKMAEEFARD